MCLCVYLFNCKIVRAGLEAFGKGSTINIVYDFTKLPRGDNFNVFKCSRRSSLRIVTNTVIANANTVCHLYVFRPEKEKDFIVIASNIAPFQDPGLLQLQVLKMYV